MIKICEEQLKFLYKILNWGKIIDYQGNYKKLVNKLNL